MIEEIEAKTLLSRVKYQEWFGASYNMNLYRGCCHGCIYCDSRSECYHVEIGRASCRERVCMFV